MAKSTNSRLNYTYQPNELLTFISYQCQIVGDPVRIDKSEAGFIRDAYDPEKRLVERRRERRSGSSTLIALVGMYNILKGKDVYIFFENTEMQNHFRHNTLEDINLVGLSKIFNGNSELSLGMGDNATKPMYLKNYHSAAMRGSGADLIIVDKLVRRKSDLDELKESLAPCVVDKGGKLIINIVQ